MDVMDTLNIKIIKKKEKLRKKDFFFQLCKLGE